MSASHKLFLPGQWSLYSKQSFNFPWPSSQGNRAGSRIEVSHGQTNPRGELGAAHSLPFPVTAVLQKGRARSGGDFVSGVDAGGSPSSSSCCSLCPDISRCSSAPSTSLAPGCRIPASGRAFLQRLPKQVVCWEVCLEKQTVTTGLSPGAECGADGELLRHCSCRYKFCYCPAFQCGFIFKTGIFVTSSESSCSPDLLKAFSS